VEVRGTTYRLARLRGSELDAVVPLFRQVYKRSDFTADWLEKKYAGEFQGAGAFSCVAFTETGEPAASLGVLPWPIRCGGRTEVAAQIVDAATGLSHRRRGLFTRLGEMARQLSQVAGMSFMFGFARPQGESYPRLVRNLGYAHIDDLVEYRRPIRTLWGERIMRRSGAVRPLYERYLRRTLGAYRAPDPVFQNSVISEGFAGTDRSPAFYEYKRFGGSRVITADGGRVWLNIKRGLIIGDLEAESAADMGRTTHMLARLGVRLGVHQVLFQASRHTRFSQLAAQHFRASPILAVVYRNLNSEIAADRLRFTFGDLDNF